MRICARCNNEREDSFFAFKNTKKGIIRTVCKECTRAASIKHYNENKDVYYKRNLAYRDKSKEYVWNYKLKHPCKCGESHPACLDFHHRDPSTKEFNISMNMDSGINKIKKEIVKCDIICANCHRKLHYNERNFLLE